jgi:uncharacterized protein
MRFEWDPRKAAANRRKHGVSFEDAATAVRDTLAATGDDPDHSLDEDRFVTFGVSTQGRLLAVAHTEREGVIRIITARAPRDRSEKSMKKANSRVKDELRKEYRRADFGKMIRGKYAGRTAVATNVVVLDPEVAKAFPNDRTVNDALRSLIKIAEATTRPAKRSRGRAA